MAEQNISNDPLDDNNNEEMGVPYVPSTVGEQQLIAAIANGTYRLPEAVLVAQALQYRQDRRQPSHQQPPQHRPPQQRPPQQRPPQQQPQQQQPPQQHQYYSQQQSAQPSAPHGLMYSSGNNPLGNAQLGASSSSHFVPHPRPAAASASSPPPVFYASAAASASSPPPVSYASAPVPRQIPAALGPVTGGFKPSYMMLNSTDRNTINGWASYERTIEAFLNRVKDTYPLPPPPFTPRSSAEVSKFWTKAEILILVYENEFGIFSPGNSKLKKPKGYHFASWVTLRLAEWGFNRAENGIDSFKCRLYKEKDGRSWVSASNLVQLAKDLVEKGIDSKDPGHAGVVVPIEAVERECGPNDRLTFGLSSSQNHKAFAK